MLRFICLALLASPIFAMTIYVSKGDVLISENSKDLLLKNGASKEVASGATLCYKSGKGKVKIPELKRQLKKPGRCIMIPLEESAVNKQIDSIKNMVKVSFWDSSESVKHGVGTKGETEFEDTGAIIVSKEQKELIIYGKEFGPLPVRIVLKDKKGNEVSVFENEESEITMFRINRQQLHSGMSIEIYNGFDELLINKNIIVR